MKGVVNVDGVGAGVVRVRLKYALHAGDGVPRTPSRHFIRKKVSSGGAGCEWETKKAVKRSNTTKLGVIFFSYLRKERDRERDREKILKKKR